MRLLPTQKNHLFKLIEAAEMPANQFSYEETIDSKKQIIVDIGYLSLDDFYFLIKSGQSSYPYTVEYCPAESSFSRTESFSVWQEVAYRFNHWLLFLKRETEVEDLWDKLNKTVKNLNIYEPTDASMFTISQFEVLSDKINQLQKSLNTLTLPQTTLQAMDEKLGHILLEAKKMNKFDWQGYFLGVMASLMIALAVNQDVQQQFWQLVKTIFNDGTFLK